MKMYVKIHLNKSAKGKIMKKLTVLLMALFASFFVYSQDSASGDVMNNYTITSYFGDARGDHFHTGIDLAAVGEFAYSLMDSEIIFHNSKKNRDINYGLGNFVVMQSQDNNYRISYSHLSDDHLDYKKKIYKKSEKLALVGNTGHSTGSHLHLEIEDLKNKRILNPLSFLKTSDKLSPVINDAFFKTGEGEIISFFKNSKLKRGGKLYISAFDRINNISSIMTPYMFKVIIGGKETSIIKFDYLRKSDNNLFLSDTDFKYEDIYSGGVENEYFLMDFNSLPGLVGFHIITEDFYGNKAEIRKAFRVLPPDI